MIEFWDGAILVIVSLCGGITVGTSVVAFFVALDIIPRLVQVVKIQGYSFLYEIMLVLGMVLFTFAYLWPIRLSFGKPSVVILGLIMGVYMGFLAGALAEVLNVIPVMTERLKIGNFVIYIVVALSLGKVCGSLVYWFFPMIYQ